MSDKEIIDKMLEYTCFIDLDEFMEHVKEE